MSTIILNSDNLFPEIFEEFHPDARVWLFQSERKISDAEQTELLKDLANYTQTWRSHGDDLASMGRIVKDQFIVLIADTISTQIGGCSQDDMMRFIQSVEKKYNLSLLNRSLVALLVDDEVQLHNLNELSNKVKEHVVSEKSLMFDNMVRSRADFQHNWLKPLKDSWVSKFL